LIAYQKMATLAFSSVAYRAPLSMSRLMAAGAKSYQVLGRIIAQSVSPLNVVDLRAFHSPAPLATPAVSLQNFLAKLAISFGIKF